MPDTLTNAALFVAALPYSQALGMALETVAEGFAVLTMPYDTRLIGDRETGVIHGGAVSALMDTAASVAVLSHPAAGGATATLNLRIDYMRPATPGQSLRARAECHHVTRSVAFIRAVATDDDESRPVAMATGAFTVGAA